MDISFDLIEKYNVPVPRYTSYPTVPYWKDNLNDNSDWIAVIQKSLENKKKRN